MALSLSRTAVRINASARIARPAPLGHQQIQNNHFSSSSSLASKASANVSDEQLPSITLYQYAICPFCHKVKSLLSYVGIEPQNTIEVNPLTKSELPKGDYRKVPIAIFDEVQVNGSDDIVQALLERKHVQSTLESRWRDEGGSAEIMTMDTFQSSENSKKWADFASNDLAGLMYPNICRTLSDSFAAFGYVDNVATFTPIQRGLIKGVGSLAMYMAASKIKKKRNIDDEQEALREAMRKFEQEGLDGGNKSFGSGQKHPDLGDVTVYGTLTSVKGLPAFDMALGTRPIQEWYDRMEKEMRC